MAHWLLKTEPDTFSIDDLKTKGVEPWDGVRNYTARNNLKSMAVGEHVFVYHSSTEIPGVAGIGEVVREAYPDATQFDPASTYHDPKATPEKPRWYSPDISFVERFTRLVPLAELRETPGLESMVLLQRSRLSVQPVSDSEWEIICGLGRAG